MPAPQNPDPPPPLADTIGAAFRQANPVESIMQAIGSQPGGEVDPNHNPFAEIKGRPYEEHASAFIDSPNQATT
jgi:hypothetical protein